MSVTQSKLKISPLLPSYMLNINPVKVDSVVYNSKKSKANFKGKNYYSKTLHDIGFT